MKLRSLLFAGCAACAAALTSCDGTETLDAKATTHDSVEARGDGQLERSYRSGALGVGVRTRADAAFAEMAGGGRTRFESRIGLQPWPEELPTNWPTPSQASVVAVAKQEQGDLLVLVDLPGSLDQALESYRGELRARGYHVVRSASHPSPHALHAKRGEDEAVLTFFGRKRATRLEILFVGHTSG